MDSKDHRDDPQYTKPLRTMGADDKGVISQQAVVQLREETLVAQKQWVEVGAVLIRKELEERTETLPVEVGYEEVHVDRVQVNRALAEGEKAVPRQEGDTYIVPIIEEEIVVTKRLVVREELRITKRRLARHEELTGTVRAERVNIETTGSIKPGGQEDSTETRG
ncbi:MAG TPA: YsnF/AvaK domain-containing protein [Chloroflexia bacterium]|nr:YsnF/AvaK domain-containing protein [Chloroflexia bacterium]